MSSSEAVRRNQFPKTCESIEIEFSPEDVTRILSEYAAKLYGRSGFSNFSLERAIDKFETCGGEEAFTLKFRSFKRGLAPNPESQKQRAES